MVEGWHESWILALIGESQSLELDFGVDWRELDFGVDWRESEFSVE